MLDGRYNGFEVTTHEPGIALLTFNRPERKNGLSWGVKRDLLEVFIQAQNDDNVRTLVLTGSGDSFSAGDDIAHGSEPERLTPTLMPPRVPRSPRYQPIHSYGSLRSYSQPTTRALRDLDKPTIAAINGVAIQSGLSLALACDIRLAASSARLGSATLRFGYLPDEGGHWLIVRTIGLARAKEFLMRARIVSAEEASALGLVGEVVDPLDLLPRALELAGELAARPAVALRLLKRAIDNSLDLTFEQACDDIASKTAIGDHHEDAREGVAAFREKRAPRFNGWLEGNPVT